MVREARLRAGLSQEALAELAGLHRTYISLLERGQRSPSVEVVSVLAAALGTSASALISQAEERLRGPQ
ncbi:helix-turn-helix domain-containing protein [Myxococcota bacterium]|nr:helix-turn-helix domain-containing protein [Myxococcota bacterium]